MKNVFKNKIFLVLLLALGVIAFGILGTYAYVSFFVNGRDNVIVSGCLKLSISEGNGLALDGSLPVSDATGMAKDPYTFTISNTCTLDADYKVSLNVLDNSNVDNVNKVKLSLGDTSSHSLIVNPILVGNLEKNVLTDAVDGARGDYSYLLDSGTLGVGESKSYALNMWISSDIRNFEGRFDTKVITEATVNGDN